MGQRDIGSYETSMKRKNRIRAASMCRLDVDSAVKEVEQPRDALSSSRYLLGRGVKRKLSECDGGGGGDSASLGLPYPEQRQLVLDLCLDKLQSCQRRPEPSLHRSVLLANTLRHLQQEMRQEGSSATANPPPPLPPPAPSLHALTPRHTPDLPPVPSDLQPGATLSSDDPDVRAHQLEEDEGDTGSGHHLAPLQDSLFGAFEITSSTSCYLSDLPLDDIFEDIDTSMYDASDFSALALAPTQRGSAASGGNTGSSDDGLKGFATSGCTPSSALQFCLSDLNDLDHIMEILVHS